MKEKNTDKQKNEAPAPKSDPKPDTSQNVLDYEQSQKVSDEERRLFEISCSCEDPVGFYDED